MVLLLALIPPRVATTAVALLRNEYVTSGRPSVPDSVVTEIVDRVYLPLVATHRRTGERVGAKRPSGLRKDKGATRSH